MVTKNGARPFLKMKIKEPMFTTYSLDLMDSPENSGKKKYETTAEKL